MSCNVLVPCPDLVIHLRSAQGYKKDMSASSKSYYGTCGAFTLLSKLLEKSCHLHDSLVRGKLASFQYSQGSFLTVMLQIYAEHSLLQQYALYIQGKSVPTAWSNTEESTHMLIFQKCSTWSFICLTEEK